MHKLICLLAVLLPVGFAPTASAQSLSQAQLRSLAAQYPPMPVDTVSMSQLLGRPATFSSGGPFNDLEFTVLTTDYIDGENGGFDVFLPVDPSNTSPGSNTIKYVRTVLNTDLNERYGVAGGARVILGDARNGPYFLRGSDGIDNDYAVIQHLDYSAGFLELAGQRSDYALVDCSVAQGCRTSGWYLFHIASGTPDLIAFVHNCDAIQPSVSGNPPVNPNPLCNASKQLSLDDTAQVRYARTVAVDPAMKGGIQFGGPGKEIIGALAEDASGNVYVVGASDGSLSGESNPGNALFIYSATAGGEFRWIKRLALPHGSMLKGATTDADHLYACGRTLGALPGFVNAGRWDAILLKYRLSDGELVAQNQAGNPGIDGYGDCILDDSGHLLLAGQGSPSGEASTNDRYLVAKHRASDLTRVWAALDRPPVGGFVASAEAWGKLDYAPAGAPGQGRLTVSGWYFGPGGAEAFLAVYDQLHLVAPRRQHALVLGSQSNRAEWILGAKFDDEGRIFAVGYTTGDVGGTQQGEGDIFVIRYAPDLTQPLRRQYGTAKSEWTRAMGFDDAGRLHVIGNTFGDFGAANADPARESADVFVLTLDRDLNPINITQFGSPHEDRAFGVVRTDHITLAGTTEGSLFSANNGSLDGFIMRLDAASTSFPPEISGSWYNVQTPGQGFNLDMVNPGRFLFYFYGFHDDGEQLWLYGDYNPGPATFAWNKPLTLDMYVLDGGGFQDFSAPSSRVWGTARVSFETCRHAIVELTGESGVQVLQLDKLNTSYGLNCSLGGSGLAAKHGSLGEFAPLSATATMSFPPEISGSWYNVQTPGQGFNLDLVNPDRFLLYFYGFHNDGEQLWLYGDYDPGATTFAWDKSLTLEMYVLDGGGFQSFTSPSSRVWGTARISFENCRRAMIELTGETGSQVLRLDKLNTSLGLDCR